MGEGGDGGHVRVAGGDVLVDAGVGGVDLQEREGREGGWVGE